MLSPRPEFLNGPFRDRDVAIDPGQRLRDPHGQVAPGQPEIGHAPLYGFGKLFGNGGRRRRRRLRNILHQIAFHLRRRIQDVGDIDLVQIVHDRDVFFHGADSGKQETVCAAGSDTAKAAFSLTI